MLRQTINFAKLALENGGKISHLTINSEECYGQGLCNPSIMVLGEEIWLNLRVLNYTLYHSDFNKFEHIWGALVYVHPEDDQTLRTTNFLCKLNENLEIAQYSKIDTSLHDKTPIWTFIGLEDGRLIRWDDKLYICGVRRDTTTNGEGRMELSELVIKDGKAVEISRTRIPAPGENNTYCEKNWMPITDQPYHYVKWTNPTEVVKFDPATKTTVTTKMGVWKDLRTLDLRGGSQVIPWQGGYLCVTHEVDFQKCERGLKDGNYRHRFVYWDRNFDLIKISPVFSFMEAKIEFACGMAEHKGDLLISFGFQDNAAYVLRVSSDFVLNFIYINDK